MIILEEIFLGKKEEWKNFLPLFMSPDTGLFIKKLEWNFIISFLFIPSLT